MSIDRNETTVRTGGRRPRRHDADGKACFDSIYTQEDPREYYRILYGLDYIIPDLAKPIFRNAVKALEQARGRRITVLDVGCSYGNNGLLLRLPLDFHRLAQRYSDLGNVELTSKELMQFDRNYFKGWPAADIRVIGLDASEEAIGYAKAVGAIDEGLAVNLETNELTHGQKALLKDVDLVISTGCIGYVGATTFSKIMAAIKTPDPWVASFVLRMYRFDEIETVLAERSLVTEKLQGVTFVQRRFHSADECESVLGALADAGISTLGKEDEGLLNAEFLLSRPQSDIDQDPLEQIATVTTGAEHAFGRRFRRNSSNTIRLIR